MDVRLEQLRSLLTELGCHNTLSCLNQELFQSQGNLKISEPFGVRRPEEELWGKVRPDIVKKNTKDFDTTKSLTPEKDNKKSSFQSNNLLGFTPASDLKAEKIEKPRLLAENQRNKSAKSEDVPQKKRHAQPKSNHQISEAFEDNEKFNSKGGQLPSQKKNPNFSFDKSDHTLEFSFREEDDLSPNSSVNKSPKPEPATFNTAKEHNPSPLVGSKMRIDEFPSGYSGEKILKDDASNYKSIDRSSDFQTNASRLNKQISLINRVIRPQNIFVPIAEDNFIQVFSTNNQLLKQLIDYLSVSKPRLFPKPGTVKFIGTQMDEQLIKKITEETKILKLDLRVFIIQSPTPGYVREKYKVEKNLMESTFSKVVKVA